MRRGESPIASIVRIVAVSIASLLLVSLSGCVFITGNLNPFASTPQPLEEHLVSGEGDAKVLLLDISNVISNTDQEGTLGFTRRESTTARVREELEQAGKDDHVRAVVLRINSPGGTVTASDMIFRDLLDFKGKHKVPLIAQFLDLGTSGAYYVALAADEIIATPTTVTGSIGVVMYGVNFSGLMDKLGIKNQTLKAGARKDIGSPLRPMTADDERILQGVLNQMHDRFLTLVREHRPGASYDAIQTVADGRILTADQAVEAGLVDRVGYLDDAIESAKQYAQLKQARVVLYRRGPEYAENIYSQAPAGPAQINLVNLDFGGVPQAAPQFLYMWLPGQ